MDEGGGGFPHNDTNLIFKSTDGGSTWSNTYTGTPFPGPGVTSSGYFACMFNDNSAAYWRHEGWGEPAAFNNIVHLVYSQQGAPGDPGDVYYIRSTDGGVTFAAPLKLNTDSTTSSSVAGLTFRSARLALSWRRGMTREKARTAWRVTRTLRVTGCGRASPTTTAQSWLPDDMLSDVVSPLPAQPDPNIVPTYVGDYDYGSAIALSISLHGRTGG